MDSLYFTYLEERQGIKSLCQEDGFVTYKISGLECFIVDMCLSKEKRGQGLGRKLLYSLIKVAKESGCEVLTANLHLKDKGANNTLIASMLCGFEVTGAQSDILLISKNIKEDSNGR